MRTTLFEWASEQGISMRRLARMTGYSERHLYRVWKEPGKFLNQGFADRVVGRLGEWARSLFFSSDVSVEETYRLSEIRTRPQEAA
jgi:hypothetical protein